MRNRRKRTELNMNEQYLNRKQVLDILPIGNAKLNQLKKSGKLKSRPDGYRDIDVFKCLDWIYAEQYSKTSSKSSLSYSPFKNKMNAQRRLN